VVLVANNRYLVSFVSTDAFTCLENRIEHFVWPRPLCCTTSTRLYNANGSRVEFPKCPAGTVRRNENQRRSPKTDIYIYIYISEDDREPKVLYTNTVLLL